MARNDAFLEAAREIAEMIQQRITNLEREGQEIETRLRQINAQQQVARGLSERLLNFQPMRGSDYQCPRCWVEYEKRSAMRPVTSNTDDDFFECPVCGFEVEVPSGNT